MINNNFKEKRPLVMKYSIDAKNVLRYNLQKKPITVNSFGGYSRTYFTGI